MRLEEIVEIARTNEDLVRELNAVVSDAVDEATADRVLQALVKTEQLVAQIDNQNTLTVEVRDAAARVAAANIEKARLEEQLENAMDEADVAYFENEIAALEQPAAAWGTVAAYQGVVVFSNGDIDELRGLLTEAARDIQNRQNVATAISITAKALTVASKIALKIAKPV